MIQNDQLYISYPCKFISQVMTESKMRYPSLWMTLLYKVSCLISDADFQYTACTDTGAISHVLWSASTHVCVILQHSRSIVTDFQYTACTDTGAISHMLHPPVFMFALFRGAACHLSLISSIQHVPILVLSVTCRECQCSCLFVFQHSP